MNGCIRNLTFTNFPGPVSSVPTLAQWGFNDHRIKCLDFWSCCNYAKTISTRIIKVLLKTKLLLIKGRVYFLKKALSLGAIDRLLLNPDLSTTKELMLIL